MRRREALRASAAALGGAGATLAGLRLGSRRSTAETALSLDVAGDKTTLGSDESVEAVMLDVSVEWAYELPDGATPDTLVVEIAAGEDSPEVLDSEDSAQMFGEADGEESFETDLVEAEVLSAAALEDEKEVEVEIEARMRVEDADGEALARESTGDSATVSVEVDSVEAADYGEVGGSGELRIEKA